LQELQDYIEVFHDEDTFRQGQVQPMQRDRNQALQEEVINLFFYLVYFNL